VYCVNGYTVDIGGCILLRKTLNQSGSGFKYNFLADCYVQKHVFLLYVTNINILTQVLTVLQIVK